MLGIIYSKFLDHLEERFSLNIVDQVIEDLNLPNHGAYSGVGFYNPKEFLNILQGVASNTQIPASNILYEYGQWLFPELYHKYSHYQEIPQDTILFLANLEKMMQREVFKLYQNVELPRFIVESQEENELRLLYHSNLPLGDFIEGFIRGGIQFFGDNVSCKRENIEQTPQTKIRFIVTKNDRRKH